MGIFDLFGTSDKKIYSRDFYKALRQVSELSEKERAYVEGVFKDDLKDGLSGFEIKERCRNLLHKSGDLLEPSEVEKIRDKLLEYFK